MVQLCQTATMSFRQADLLAKRFHPRIAAKQGEFRKRRVPGLCERGPATSAIQSFESAILVAQTGEDQGLLKGLSR